MASPVRMSQFASRLQRKARSYPTLRPNMGRTQTPRTLEYLQRNEVKLNPDIKRVTVSYDGANRSDHRYRQFLYYRFPALQFHNEGTAFERTKLRELSPEKLRRTSFIPEGMAVDEFVEKHKEEQESWVSGVHVHFADGTKKTIATDEGTDQLDVFRKFMEESDSLRFNSCDVDEMNRRVVWPMQVLRLRPDLIQPSGEWVREALKHADATVIEHYDQLTGMPQDQATSSSASFKSPVPAAELL